VNRKLGGPKKQLMLLSELAKKLTNKYDKPHSAGSIGMATKIPPTFSGLQKAFF
jgi:hypothetical protein